MADPNALTVPLTDDDHYAALVFTCVTVTLCVLTLATLVARISMKFHHGLRLGWDDYLLVIGCALAAADWATFMATISFYVRRSRSFVSMNDVEYIIKLGVIGISFWGVSVTCIKVGVAVQLLRFQSHRLWRLFLYVIIGFIVATSAAYVLFDLLQCIPLQTTWNLSITNKNCVGNTVFQKVSNTQSGVSISTDIILSLFPLTFLRHLRRPRSEKVLIGVLMAMGMAASAASITKAVLVHQWVYAIDIFKVGFAISMWTCVEMFIGVIAACLPSLKSTIQMLLTKAGIDFTADGLPSFFKSFSTRSEGAETQPVESFKFSTMKSGSGSVGTGALNPMDSESGNESGTLGNTGTGSREDQSVDGRTRVTETV